MRHNWQPYSSRFLSLYFNLHLLPILYPHRNNTICELHISSLFPFSLHFTLKNTMSSLFFASFFFPFTSQFLASHKQRCTLLYLKRVKRNTCTHTQMHTQTRSYDSFTALFTISTNLQVDCHYFFSFSPSCLSLCPFFQSLIHSSLSFFLPAPFPRASLFLRLFFSLLVILFRYS